MNFKTSRDQILLTKIFLSCCGDIPTMGNGSSIYILFVYTTTGPFGTQRQTNQTRCRVNKTTEQKYGRNRDQKERRIKEHSEKKKH